jgi:hypothetical protein
MKKHQFITLITCLLLIGFKASAQDHTAETIQKSSDKIKRIEKNYGVVERTFADMIFADDSASRINRVYKHYFSASNRYNLNAFAADEDISQMVLSVVQVNTGGTSKVLADNTTQYADVSLSYKPAVSGYYYVVVNGVLKDKNAGAFFNLIIERN